VAKSVKIVGFGGGAGASRTDALGGLASPEMAIVGLSSITGPVSGSAHGPVANAVAKAVSNVFDPTQFFGDAKLLGGIKLGSIVDARQRSAWCGAEVPLTQNGTDAVTTFEWKRT
jgi:hypothetical protein